ncbi:hypothetical protein CDD80_4592 [Ophiocordyceps camponoti-rufipedis]|uniref:Uncharacterized protein n=1 Tax=Ophiocordyceps camponoti-rufipedis TaxID=2004952 RepID=A0A2C5YU91_9HYPO|nr:hypothetical protein CDD80_4592 [Ophiocordyceps camponoti-rufipedis]
MSVWGPEDAEEGDEGREGREDLHGNKDESKSKPDVFVERPCVKDQVNTPSEELVDAKPCAGVCELPGNIFICEHMKVAREHKDPDFREDGLTEDGRSGRKARSVSDWSENEYQGEDGSIWRPAGNPMVRVVDRGVSKPTQVVLSLG